MKSDKINGIDLPVTLQELRKMLPAVREMTGSDIRNIRDKHQLSQAMLAEYLNMTTDTVSKWERDEKKPNGAALRVLSEIERKGRAAFIV